MSRFQYPYLKKNTVHGCIAYVQTKDPKFRQFRLFGFLAVNSFFVFSRKNILISNNFKIGKNTENKNSKESKNNPKVGRMRERNQEVEIQNRPLVIKSQFIDA